MSFKIRISLVLILAGCMFTPILMAQESTEYFGTVLKKTGNTVTVQMDASVLLTAGISLDVYTFFKKNIFGMDTTGWLHAAEAKLVSVRDTTAVIRVTREKSPMTVNNRKVEYLKPGTKVKLILK